MEQIRVGGGSLNPNIYKIKIDTILELKNEHFTVSASDINSHKLNIEVTQNNEPYPLTYLTVEIDFLKSDGKLNRQNTDKGITITDPLLGKVDCILETNSINKQGRVRAEVLISKNGDLLTTKRFEFYATNPLASDKVIESSTDFPLLKQMLLDEIERKEMEIIREQNEVIRQQLRLELESIRGQLQAWLDNPNLFVGPQGMQGPRGIQGGIGPQGPQGLKGDKGLKGDTGARGIDGVKGEQGIQGPKGDKGDKGDRGQGLDYNTMTQEEIDNIKGIKGDKGDAGLKGDKGEKGDKGDKGDIGLTGAEGAKGDKGDKGIQGERGIQGIQGEQGIQGIQGIQGETGATGSIGNILFFVEGDTIPVLGDNIIAFVYEV